MKNIYVAVGATVAFLAWRRGKRLEDARKEITEAPITDGTNWQGNLWQRLAGLDLVAPGKPNLCGSINAEPGHIGRANLGLNPSWNGGL